MKKLTAQQRQELVRLEKQIPHKGVSTRIKIILALDLGYTAKETAEILLLDEATVRKWKKLYRESRYLSDWLGDENTGYRGRLTWEQEKIVEKMVEREVITDCQQVAEYIHSMFDINYTIDGVTKLLHRLGFVYKQVVGIPGKLNEEKQQAFVKTYEELQKNKTEDEVVLFGDGVHPTHNLHKTKAWVKKGEEKQVPIQDEADSISMERSILRHCALPLTFQKQLTPKQPWNYLIKSNWSITIKQPFI